MLATHSKSPRILNYSKHFRKTDLNELWSDRLIEILITNPSKLHFGQEVLHDNLQRLHYDLGDMNTTYPNIEEYMKFTKVIIVKQKLKEKCLGTKLYSSVWTIETNIF
jgi:hypothetical protein